MAYLTDRCFNIVEQEGANAVVAFAVVTRERQMDMLHEEFHIKVRFTNWPLTDNHVKIFLNLALA